MKKITPKMPVTELAALVCQHLAKRGIDAVLTGGTVVLVYSPLTDYDSKDIDFVTHARHAEFGPVLAEIGFVLGRDRHFVHPDTEYILDFVAPPVAIGNEPVTKLATKQTRTGTLTLLTPTQCVMDRLVSYYYWESLQSMEQAIAVAQAQRIKWTEVERWSMAEGKGERYKLFRRELAKRRRRRSP